MPVSSPSGSKIPTEGTGLREAKLQPMFAPPLPPAMLAQPTPEQIAMCYKDYCKLYYSNIILTNQVSNSHSKLQT